MFLTTYNHLCGMLNEINFAKNIEKYFYGTKAEDFTYVVYDDSESRNLVKLHLDNSNIAISYDTIEQCEGTDFKYKDVSIDLKVHNSKYLRPYFELFHNGSRYTYNKGDGDTHIIANVMQCDGRIIFAPAKVIEDIVNKEYKDDDMFSDLYKNKDLLQLHKNGKKDKMGFIISPKVIIEFTKRYLKEQCKNTNMLLLLLGGITFIDFTGKYI